MKKIFNTFERYIVIAIIIMMMVTILFATIELGVILVKELLNPPKYLLDLNDMMELFGFFFTILIGLELMETVKAYLTEDRIHVEIVFLVAMIAIARKVIILDYKTYNPITLLGIAAIIISLSAGYFLLKRAHKLKNIQSSESQ